MQVPCGKRRWVRWSLLTRDGSRMMLAQMLHWRPRTYPGVALVALGGGVIYFVGTAVDPVWAVSTRVVLAVVLVLAGIASGSLRLRHQRESEQRNCNRTTGGARR